jgi:hypothetical protein
MECSRLVDDEKVTDGEVMKGIHSYKDGGWPCALRGHVLIASNRLATLSWLQSGSLSNSLAHQGLRAAAAGVDVTRTMPDSGICSDSASHIAKMHCF